MFKKTPEYTRILVMLIVIGMLLTACAGRFAAEPEMQRSGAPAAPQEPGFAGDVEQSQGAFSVSNTLPQAERLVIKDANLSMVVNDPAESMNKIASLAEEYGGYVVSAELYQDRLESGVEVPHASITIRVPAERFDEALGTIRTESDRIPINENINSQDVTSDYTDLQSRLRNLESAESQLTEIMGSANKTEDVLSVYNQLVQVREQIEVIKGQIKYYEQSAALSAIRVDLQANEAVQPLTIGGWQPVGVAKDAVQALINTVKFVASAAIWIIIFVLPTLLLLYAIFVLPISFVWRTFRRRRAARKAVKPQTPTTTE